MISIILYILQIIGLMTLTILFGLGIEKILNLFDDIKKIKKQLKGKKK